MDDAKAGPAVALILGIVVIGGFLVAIVEHGLLLPLLIVVSILTVAAGVIALWDLADLPARRQRPRAFKLELSADRRGLRVSIERARGSPVDLDQRDLQAQVEVQMNAAARNFHQPRALAPTRTVPCHYNETIVACGTRACPGLSTSTGSTTPGVRRHWSSICAAVACPMPGRCPTMGDR